MKTTLRSARALACALAFAPAFFCGADDQPPAKTTDPSPPPVATDPAATPPPDTTPPATPPAAALPAATPPAPPIVTLSVATPPPARPALKAVRAEVVMVDVWGGKFDVEHEGVVHHFNLEYGGLLFYKGKPVTLKSFGIGQQVLLEVLPDRKGKWGLWTASIVPRDEIRRNPSDVAKTSGKEARRLAKAEAKAKKRAEEEARAQAKAEARAQQKAQEAEAEQQAKADKEARKLAKAEAKAKEQAEVETRAKSKADAVA
jgi:hypothetical protein